MDAYQGLERRPGFTASPRVAVPAILLFVALLAALSFAGGAISSVRVVATVVAGSALILLFGLLLVLSRGRREKRRAGGASAWTDNTDMGG